MKMTFCDNLVDIFRLEPHLQDMSTIAAAISIITCTGIVAPGFSGPPLTGHRPHFTGQRNGPFRLSLIIISGQIQPSDTLKKSSQVFRGIQTPHI